MTVTTVEKVLQPEGMLRPQRMSMGMINAVIREYITLVRSAYSHVFLLHYSNLRGLLCIKVSLSRHHGLTPSPNLNLGHI